MKFLALLILIPNIVFAIVGSPIGYSRDAAVTPIPKSYSDTNALLLENLYKKTHIAVTNNSIAAPIAFCLNAVSVDACTDQVIAGATLIFALDDIGLADKIYIRTLADEPIITGKIYITVW